MGARPPRPYTANPCYLPTGGPVVSGWDALAASLRLGVSIVAVEGPTIANWSDLVAGLGKALEREGRELRFVEAAQWLLPWDRVQRLTSSLQLRNDPDFDFLASGALGDLFRPPSHLTIPPGTLLVVYGPGAALASHDVLWYADLPKRYAEAAVGSGAGRNLGQPEAAGPATTKRLFFVDWPLLDRHRDQLCGHVDCWIDMQDPTVPAWVSGDVLRATIAGLATRPFRTRPTFNTTPWGGHWGQRRLGHNPDAPNTALGYELITPEAGVLIGTVHGPRVELPVQLIVTRHPEQLLGATVHTAFGTSFPIRFDYLDTLGGGNLSVHCHPQEGYMREFFGWPYTQDESYYVMMGGEGRKVFLGLRQNADVDAFQREAAAAERDGAPFDVEQYVPTFAARRHQLLMIPAGTPHGSGEGNVVLEISATPYLYSLRFYDWLRRDVNGSLRPVHVHHAFLNLNRARRGDSVARDLVQQPRVLRGGDGWQEELIGALPEMFYEIRRFALQPGAVADDDSATGFHVLNVVEGDGVVVQPASGTPHFLAYAETLVVPAGVGRYHVRPLGANQARVVKAVVRS